MRWLKALLALLVVLLAAAAIVVWTLPADVGYRFGARFVAPAVLTGLRGTVWDGHADGVSVLGVDLGELDWHARKWPLLGGQFVADLRLAGADVEVAGLFTRGPGTLALRDVRFRVPADAIGPVLDNGALRLLGTLGGVVDQATLAGGRITDASGSLRWSDAGVSGAADARFSEILATFAADPGGGIAGTLHDDGTGPLALQGRFTVSAVSFDLEATLRARDGDPAMAAALRRIGEPQPDGSSRLEIHQRLLPAP